MTPEEWTAVRLSLLVAVTAMVASLPFGIAIAYALARGRFWGKSLLDTLVHLPLILPPVVTGYFLLILFGRRGPLGDRSGRQQARKRRGHAGRQPDLGVRHRHAAALPARRDRRRHPVLCQV